MVKGENKKIINNNASLSFLLIKLILEATRKEVHHERTENNRPRTHTDRQVFRRAIGQPWTGGQSPVVGHIAYDHHEAEDIAEIRFMG